ncbi:MAG: phosphoribosyl transferase [Flavobacteriia bacterium]|nr:phosphoribosyl transferase [Flavobacteriia bacterium]OIP48531.1 MAG: phosphoribosyl transferase [Flavobacteriaceae bacterium CG2_30_31_66]PIV97101.1 MAG: phosphoribosyl transferase [Flavobacteriaceae bacterium CG17_big_fil_post_rev_8_21_14_2_50_31_13]PIX11335.1 MAG: phosphoribosyl transferase [Flavobacteriaceae bacterium CG_4_8_14_3_um_filter_31_8]PIY13726.1 MAG: phosphoribosyl transferase [Flavobacteriaceae bacterium CG_4_10_14_3_um_filter_31_253]PIZ10780.1 MAG: phosphoribosyl transferase 
MNYRNITALNNIILKRLSIIPRDFDLIVGVPRSGMLPANLLALYLNRPYTDIHSFLNGHIYKAGARSQFFDISEFKKILVVDDSIASGSAMIEVKESLKHLESKFDIKYCAVYIIPGKEKMVDYFFEIVPLPRYFQWNILNHTTLEKACFDIDGVLCEDPLPEQNDDGEKYIDFILNAPPLFIPGSKIGTIVTSRLEKYRKETETWLKNNNIKYNDLVMLDLPNMAARQKANNHGDHKAKAYMAKPYVLFVESELHQAIEINRISKKPVLCTANFEMIFESESFMYNLKSGKHLPFLRKYGLKLRDFLKKFK